MTIMQKTNCRKLQRVIGVSAWNLSNEILFPDLFFIYDSRCSTAIRQVEQTSIWNSDLVEYDYAYAKFFLRCIAFVEKANSECKISLTPRQLDKYLLYQISMLIHSAFPLLTLPKNNTSEAPANDETSEICDSSQGLQTQQVFNL